MQDNIDKDMAKNKYFINVPYLNEGRAQKFMSIALTLLALSFFGFFAINPTISTILKLRKELSDSRFVLDQLDLKIKNLSILRQQYADIQQNLPIITSAIPAQPDAQLLFAQIQTIAHQSSVKINKLQNFEVEVLRNNKTLAKQYYPYSFAISGNGTFENINKFTSSLTNMQRITNIEIFTLSNAVSQDAQSLGFNIQASAFFKE